MAFNKRQTIKRAKDRYFDLQPDRGKFSVNDYMIEYVLESMAEDGYDTVKYHDVIIEAMRAADDSYEGGY